MNNNIPEILQYDKQKPLQLIADFIVLPCLSDLQF